MEHLVIKPTLGCTASCPTCVSRRRLHRALEGARLSLVDWARVFSDASALGAWQLTISGGEPTLYEGLADLVRLGKRHGWLVRLNSNGGFDDEQLVEELLDAGLDVVDISLYSATAELHDAMRGRRGLWAQATRNIALLAKLQARRRGFRVITQTVLTRENYQELPQLLELHRRLGSCGLLVSYLEGDFEGRHQLSVHQVNRFRREVLPQALEVCRGLDWLTRDLATSAVERIFSLRTLSPERWARGAYRPSRGACSIPSTQALILANGDVHPCNIVEYTHQPVVGNVLREPLRRVWHDQPWASFRRELHPDCQRCPMARHTFVPLRAPGLVQGFVKAGLHRLRMDRVGEALVRLRHRRAALGAGRRSV